MTIAERRREIDDKISPVLAWREEELNRLYQMLYLQGCRIEGIDERILKAIREQCRGES